MADSWPQLEKVLELWKDRGILTGQEFAALAQGVKARAFSLSNVWETKFIERLHDTIQTALKDNLSSADFMQKANEVLAGFGGGDALNLISGEQFSAWYAETVFRTNVAGALAAGRYAEMFSANGIVTAEFWMFDAILDDRNDDDKKCPDMVCRSLNGKVFRKDDDEGQRWLPPLHFNCRCSVIELDAQDVADGGYDTQAGAAVAIDVLGLEGPDEVSSSVWSENKVDSLVNGKFLPGVDVMGDSGLGVTPSDTGPVYPGSAFTEPAAPPVVERRDHSRMDSIGYVDRVLKEAGYSESQAQAIKYRVSWYTGSGHDPLNKALWRYAQKGYELSEFETTVTRQIVSYLDAMPPFIDTTLFRGTQWREGFIAALEKGKIINADAFLSTSSDFGTARAFTEISRVKEDHVPVMMQIRKHSSGRSVMALTEHRSEDEVLFKPSTRFKVVSIRNTTLRTVRDNLAPGSFAPAMDLDRQIWLVTVEEVP